MNISIGLADILLISPVIVLFLFSLIPLATKVLNNNKEQNPATTLISSLMGLGIAAGVLILFGGSDQTIFNHQLLFDGLTKWAGLVAIFSAAAGIILLYENPSTHFEQFSETVFLALSSVSGMLILISAINLITVFIGLELMSLSLYLMTAMSQEQKISKEAAIKYFVLGSIASAIFLYGVSFIFGSANTVNTTDLMQTAAVAIKTDKLFLFGMVFIVVGFCFKVSIAPFHAWTPDVYQGAPTPVTSFMATAIKTASFAAFLRIAATQAFQGSQNLVDILQWLAVITMVVGNAAALIQTNLKRMLAYSSVAHSGYIFIGVITVGLSANSAYSAAAVLFYLLTYSAMTAGAFAILSMIEKSEDDFITVDGLAGFAKKQPALAFCFTIFLISMAGLPPALGFFSKFYLFGSAVNEGLIWLALWGVINSVIGVYYYLRPIVSMYMKEGNTDVSSNKLYASTVLVIAAAMFIVVMGIFSGPLFSMIERSLS